jgi:cytochrome c biogenesis protein CcmG, thiol:disulfide interchange protein DsbE
VLPHAICSLLLATGCKHADGPAAPPPSTPSHVLDAAVPAFRRPALQGGSFDTADTAGRVLVVDFFADYCKPCQRKLPAMEALHRAHPELAIVGVSLDESAAAAWRTIRRHHLTFPVVHDAGNVIGGRFRVAELPYGFVADVAGKVRYAAGPMQPEDALERGALAVMRGALVSP